MNSNRNHLRRIIHFLSHVFRPHDLEMLARFVYYQANLNVFRYVFQIKYFHL